MPTSYVPEVFLQLKRDLCDFHFSVRFNLDRLDEVLIGTETVLCTRHSPLQMITVTLNLCFRMMEFVFSHTSELNALASDSFLDFRLRWFVISCLVSGNLKRKGTEE